MKLILIPPASDRLEDAFAVARILTQIGVPIRTAKKTIDGLVRGQKTFVEAPSVEDFDRLVRDLKKFGLELRCIRHRKVDVKALRDRLNVTQEDFAGRYGLDVTTVRNWEQGRTTPDGPAAILLQMIERDPEKAAELLTS